MTAVVTLLSAGEAQRLTQELRDTWRDLGQAMGERSALRHRYPDAFESIAQGRPVLAADQSHTPTVVYFVQAGESGPIKIGVATDLAKRIAALQTGCPDSLRILATVPGGLEEERDLHRRFGAFRIRGEWFSPVESILAYIEGASS